MNKSALADPITKKTLSALAGEEEYEIEMEPIETLSRINHDSPYSKGNPIRKIDCIDTIPIQAGFCGHCCVAMLAGVPLSDVVALMGKGHASWSKILEALDYHRKSSDKLWMTLGSRKRSLMRCTAALVHCAQKRARKSNPNL